MRTGRIAAGLAATTLAGALALVGLAPAQAAPDAARTTSGAAVVALAQLPEQLAARRHDLLRHRVAGLPRGVAGIPGAIQESSRNLRRRINHEDTKHTKTHEEDVCCIITRMKKPLIAGVCLAVVVQVAAQQQAPHN